jgi:S-DNA-T family DNA segregation ATPase FtsK/SpoIIIE
MRRRLEFMADRIEAVLAVNKIPARVTGGTVTPRWVRFQVVPAVGAKISKIKGLSEELAAALDAPSVRISRRGAAVAVEIPRQDPQPVRLLPLYRQLNQDALSIAGNSGVIPAATAVLGLAEDGGPLLIRLPSPDVAHILVAGTTGSGKTVLLRAMILSLALGNVPHTQSANGRRPSSIGLVLIDPRGGGSFGCFDTLPHLVRPVVRDAAGAVEVLGSLARLMEQRDRRGESTPAVVVVIDELADLLQVGGAEAEGRLTRLTQRGRNAGIHLVAATQKPTAAALGSLVKANFPTRLVGRVTCAEDARTASGWSGTGAERLTGRGDFLAVAEGRVIRFQAAHVSEDEIAQTLAGLRRPALDAPAPLPWPANRLAQVFQGESQPVATLEQDAGEPKPVTLDVIELPPPLPPEPDEVRVLAGRLRTMGWDLRNSYRDACRALGEAEGGGRFYLVQEAVDLLRATATSRVFHKAR